MTPTQKCNILVVDDLYENRMAMEAALAPLGENLVLAESGRDALRYLMQQDFAVILLDVMMPDMDGFETAELIRARKRNRATPIIFVTALGKSGPEITKGYALGAVDYLFKPYAPEILKAKVSAFVELHRMREDLRCQRDLLQAANKELESFSYSVSHDLRAPLRHIDGFLNLLSKHAGETLDDQSRKYLQVIFDSVAHMNRLIDDLLAFSRVLRTEMTFRPVHLDRVVKGVIEDLRQDIRERKIVWDIVPLPVVMGDAALLQQVMANLIGNAVKYTSKREEARIAVDVCAPGAAPNAGPQPAPHNPQSEIVLFVRDNGAGFDPAYTDKLFGVFRRLHSQEDFAGTGIGLALVRRIVQRHGGRVWAEGEVDKGATFYLALPVQGD